MSENTDDDLFSRVAHIPDALLLDWTMRIRTGERGVEVDGIARAVIRDICLRQLVGAPHSPIALNWLCDVLGEVLDYGDPTKLLGLLPRKAKRPVSKVDRAFEVACWLRLAQEDRGYPYSEAKELAAEVFGRDVKSIERDARNAKVWISTMNLNADWEGRFLNMRRPLPPTRNTK